MSVSAMMDSQEMLSGQQSESGQCVHSVLQFSMTDRDKELLPLDSPGTTEECDRIHYLSTRNRVVLIP